jgi:hemerythrin
MVSVVMVSVPHRRTGSSAPSGYLRGRRSQPEATPADNQIAATVRQEMTMALLTWNDSYSVGVNVLDGQHTGLFETLNELHAAMMKGQAKNLTGPILNRLIEYTQEHFAAEEAMMAAAKYPGLVQHRAKHRELTNQVIEFAGRFDRGEIALSPELLTFLRDWLTVHIMKEDHQYGPWLNDHGMH